MKRKFIVTPAGNSEGTRHLLPRYRHKLREPSGLVGDKPSRIRAAA